MSDDRIIDFNELKNKVKETTDLEVKQVNITVKKAVQEKQKTEA